MGDGGVGRSGYPLGDGRLARTPTRLILGNISGYPGHLWHPDEPAITQRVPGPAYTAMPITRFTRIRLHLGRLVDFVDRDQSHAHRVKRGLGSALDAKLRQDVA